MEESFLKDFTEAEKTAFIGTIASMAIVDNVATQEEVDAISSLTDAAGITGIEKEKLLKTAKGLGSAEFDSWIATLKTSELRFALVTELITFAIADGQYSEQEKQKIEEISSRLGINSNQFSFLDDLVTKSNNNSDANNSSPKSGFLDSLGLGEMFKKTGISSSGLTKGLIAIAAPLLLSKLLGSRRGGTMGGKSAAGGMLGAAGLSTLLGLLSGGRGFSKTGGLLSKILQKK